MKGDSGEMLAMREALSIVRQYDLDNTPIEIVRRLLVERLGAAWREATIKEYQVKASPLRVWSAFIPQIKVSRWLPLFGPRHIVECKVLNVLVFSWNDRDYEIL